MSQSNYEKGKALPTEVLGAAHVERSLANVDEFTKPLQDLIMEYGWGAVWARPGLGRKERSLINLGVLTALNRQHELEIHIKGAVKNGCTKEEIREVLLHVGVYAGLPASIDAFRTAKKVIDELGL